MGYFGHMVGCNKIMYRQLHHIKLVKHEGRILLRKHEGREEEIYVRQKKTPKGVGKHGKHVYSMR